MLKILNFFQINKHKFFDNLLDLLSFFYVRIHLILAISLNLLNWLFVYIININVSQNLVILHYNVDFGVNLIGNVSEIYIIPLLGAIIILVNFILLSFIYRHDKFFANLLLGGALLVNLFLLVAVSTIYLINFYR